MPRPTTEEIKKQGFYYRYTEIDSENYRSDIIMVTTNRTLKFVLKSVMKARFRGEEYKQRLEDTERFEIEQRFFGTLKIALNQIIREIGEHVKKDGMEIINYEIKKAHFEKSKTSKTLWEVHFVVGGNHKKTYKNDTRRNSRVSGKKQR